YSIQQQQNSVLVVANFNDKPQHLDLSELGSWANPQNGLLYDLYSGQRPELFKNALVIPAFSFYWLQAS
ncbi:MAG TPA: alpha-amylase, partial [Methylophaga aminisulfidivorans]|nr:alpha-amylase [Methylophaga aminisulfidivorans]